jgi:hypothetical protein
MEGDSMFTAEQFRTKVAESAETIKNTDVPSEIHKIERSMESYSLLAQNEDWLADNFDKIIRSQDVLSEDEALGERLDEAKLEIRPGTYTTIQPSGILAPISHRKVKADPTATARSCSSTPASSAARASCPNGLARHIAPGAHRIGSRSKIRRRPQ